MANKSKKKRNKAYRGADAAIERPVITRITATNRSKLGQWWFDHKRIARPILIAVAVVAVLILLIVQLIRVLNG